MRKKTIIPIMALGILVVFAAGCLDGGGGTAGVDPGGVSDHYVHITPGEFERYEAVQDIQLLDVDSSAGTATVEFRVRSSYGKKRVYFDLNAGQALVWPSEALSSEGEDPDILRSPAGDKLVRGLAYPTEGLVIEDSNGRKIGEITDETIQKRHLQWAPDGNALIYTKRSREHSGLDLYVYPLKKRTPVHLLSGDISRTEWSPNNRYFLCFEVSTQTAVEKAYTQRRRVGSMHIFDARRDYSAVGVYGELVKDYEFSADSSKVAFTESTEDEFGYFDNTALRVLDVSSGTITDILTDRRNLLYAWAGRRHIAVTSFDKYAVPMLDLHSIDGGVKPLISVHTASSLSALAHLPAGNKIIYKAVYGSKNEELWSLTPGSDPVRLIPRKETPDE